MRGHFSITGNLKFSPFLFAITLLNLKSCGDDYWFPIAGIHQLGGFLDKGSRKVANLFARLQPIRALLRCFVHR